MLRQKLRSVLVEERYRRYLVGLMNILAVVGFLMIFSGPWFAREVFTSENALRTDNIDTHFDSDKLTYQAYSKFKRDVEALSQDDGTGDGRKQGVVRYL